MFPAPNLAACSNTAAPINHLAEDYVMLKDPRSAGPRPPFPKQQQSPSGETGKLLPTPDHGEESYRGADRESHCRELVERTLKELGHLDILVNNAAFQRTHEKLWDFTSEEIEHTFRTNIQSMFHLAKAAAAKMKPGGSIINTASIQADKPSPSLLAYATTKGAITNFTAGLAQLVAKDGIRVNAVAPGPIWTPLIPSTMPAEKAANFGADSPLGRPGQPAEVAPAYVFLASNDASYISGAVLPVTGGKPFL
jgi:NAD(P)-dependent dehydrogenase (short-subunit alcohol dehydrogenase family)